jgi:ribonuclease HII
MVAMETDHPGYGFAVHKGYSTAAHSAALNELGPCSEHRQSFINVRRVASGSGTRVRWETECRRPEEADNSAPEGAPDRHGRNGWGKMGTLNQTRMEKDG